MKTVISSNEFKKIQNKKTARTYYDRLEDAINYGFNFDNDIIIQKEESLVIKFNNVYFLSHNDILRIHFKRLYKYIKLWKERVIYISKKIDTNLWEPIKNQPLKIEFIYLNNNNEFLDYDSTIASFKFILDGLTESKIIIDDNQQHIPIILSKQIKSKDNNGIILIITPLKEEEINNYFSNESKNIVDNI